MTLRFEMTQEDQVEYNLYLIAAQSARRPWARVFLTVYLALAIPWLLWMSVRTGNLFFSLGVLFLGYLAWATTKPGQRTVLRQRVQRSAEIQKYLGPREVRLEPQGIRSLSATGERFLAWENLSLQQDTSLLVLSHSLLDAIVVPHHAFSSPQHQAEFLAAVERYRLGQTQSLTEPLKQAWYQSKDQVG